MYNQAPYLFQNSMLPASSGSIFSKINLSSILNTTQKTLNIVNQAIPLYNQVKPMFNNMKTLKRLGQELTKLTSENNNNNNKVNKKNDINNYIIDNNTQYNIPNPSFFI